VRLINKEELKALLAYYDDLYYNQDISEISDFEYNVLKEKYIKKYGEYDYIPGEASKDSKKYTHTTNISSLSKLQITDEAGIRENLERLWPVVIQEKMDGLTLVTYPSGEDVTRGNGHIGEIVTENVKKVDGIGDKLAYPVRSEVVMLHSEFNRINTERVASGLEPFENCRNAAAGMLRQKDSNKVQGLKAFAYNMIFDEEEIDEEDADAENPNARAQVQIESLEMLGWNTVDSYEPTDIDDAMEYIMNYDRSVLDFDIDGLVIKHNGNKIFGQTSHHPLNAIAIKFAPEGGWTTLIDIEWSVGRTGKVVPKAIFEPISILGSTVTKATLHNIGIVNALGLNMTESIGKNGDCITKIFVIKANDVIPAIIDVEHAPLDTKNLYSKSIWEPTTCPDCGSELRKEKDQLYCSNENCSSRVLNRLIHLSERDRFNIEDLGEETAIKLIAKYKNKLELILTQIENSYEVMTEEDYDEGIIIEEAIVKEKLEKLHPSFIYELTLDDIKSLEGFAEKSATNLYNEIQNSKNIDFDKFLAGCGIHLVGRRTSKDIAEFYYSPKDMSEVEAFAYDYADGFKKLSTLKGIGKETIASLTEYYGPYIIPFGEYGLNIKDVIPKKKATNQMSIVVTGAFDKSREEIKAMIEDAGHKMAGSVSKSTAYLLAAPGEESTSKYTKAIEVNTTIIHTLEELEEIL
jgi:DNA ligase (NAD+)